VHLQLLGAGASPGAGLGARPGASAGALAKPTSLLSCLPIYPEESLVGGVGAWGRDALIFLTAWGKLWLKIG
jgi:hypothetical protein